MVTGDGAMGDFIKVFSVFIDLCRLWQNVGELNCFELRLGLSLRQTER
jgi:hypothetical protein